MRTASPLRNYEFTLPGVAGRSSVNALLGGKQNSHPCLETFESGTEQSSRRSPCGAVELAGRQYPIGSHRAGQRVTIRLDGPAMQILDLARTLLPRECEFPGFVSPPWLPAKSRRRQDIVP
jgi:hypothetical protein